LKILIMTLLYRGRELVFYERKGLIPGGALLIPFPPPRVLRVC
jgi:hypothetical protein